MIEYRPDLDLGDRVHVWSHRCSSKSTLARRAEYGLPDAIISGPAGAMDLWLWGRGPTDDLTVTGEGEAVEALR
jgi:hypothetical protein